MKIVMESCSTLIMCECIKLPTPLLHLWIIICSTPKNLTPTLVSDFKSAILRSGWWLCWLILHCKHWHPIWVPVPISSALLPIQQVDDSPKPWDSVPAWETQKKLLTSGFGWAQLDPCGHLGSEAEEDLSFLSVNPIFQKSNKSLFLKNPPSLLSLWNSDTVVFFILY